MPYIVAAIFIVCVMATVLYLCNNGDYFTAALIWFVCLHPKIDYNKK
jgi:hypothetical protein